MNRGHTSDAIFQARVRIADCENDSPRAANMCDRENRERGRPGSPATNPARMMSAASVENGASHVAPSAP